MSDLLSALLALATLLGVPGAIFAIRDERARRERRRNPSALSAGTLDDLAERLLRLVERTSQMAVDKAPYRLKVGWTLVRPSSDLEFAILAKHAVEWRADLRGDSDLWLKGRSGVSRAPAMIHDDGKGGLADFVLNRVPTRRLFILGTQGSGKSFQLNLIVQQWSSVARRRGSVPVPVPLSMTSWDPNRFALMEWVARAIPGNYPRFADLTDAGSSAAQALVDASRILPILDGLDEMPSQMQRAAIERLSNVDGGVGFVLSCRSDLRPDIALAPRLAVTVRLQPPELGDIEGYLCEGMDPSEASHWCPVLMDLRAPSSRLRAVLMKPLGLEFTRALYTKLPGRERAWRPNPAELCDPGVDVADALRARYIDAIYSPQTLYASTQDQRFSRRWTATQARQWLTFFATHLRERANAAGVEKLQDLDWWELRHTVNRGTLIFGREVSLLGSLVGLVSGLLCGVAAGFGNHSGTGFGVDLALGIALAFLIGDRTYKRDLRVHKASVQTQGNAVTPVDNPPVSTRRARAIRQRLISDPLTPLSGLAGGLCGGLVGGFGAGLFVKLGVGHSSGMADSLAAGFGVGLASGPALGRNAGFLGASLGSLVAGLFVSVGVGWPAGLANGVAVGYAVRKIIMRAEVAYPTRPTVRPTWQPIGLVGGVTAGIAVIATGWGASPDNRWVVVLWGAVVALVAGAASGLIGRPVDRTEINTPKDALKQDQRSFVLVASSSMIATGLATILLVGFNAEYELHTKAIHMQTVLHAGLLSGIAVGVTCGLVLACTHSPWGESVVARWWLAVTKQLPLSLMSFLDDAEERGVLKIYGRSYRFQHSWLQDYLAQALAGDVASAPERGDTEAVEVSPSGRSGQ